MFNTISEVIKPAGPMNNRKAQGLPMEFIVIAALAIIVLFIVMMVFLGGSVQTNALEQQSVVNTCKSDCYLANQYTSTVNKAAFTTRDSGFCSKSFDIKGLGTKNCRELIACELIFKDGQKCTATCDTSTPKKITC